MRNIITPLLALAVTAGSLSAVAQTKGKSAGSEKSSAVSKYRRLPTYFGRLELDDEQRETIYEIKEDFGPKIEDLRQELAELQAEMSAEIEDVLTTTQKSALAKLKDGSGTKTASASKSSSARSSRSSSRRSSTSRKKFEGRKLSRFT